MEEEGKLSIGDLENVIQLLGEVYHDPRDALAEFITNAADASASKIQVFLRKRAKEPCIQISDNGCGMDHDRLKYVAENIGKSLKKFDSKTVGEKGIGILGFQKFAARCDIVSKGIILTSETLCLSLINGTLRYIIHTEKERKREICGTDVFLYGINEDTWRLFTKEKLKSYFKAKYRLNLVSDDFTLQIIEGKEAEFVQADNYKGEPFYKSTIRTDYGDIKLSLYILPNGKNCTVDVYCKNIKVTSISEIPEFSFEPWTLGKVQGEITADFVHPDTTRTSFIRDRKHFATWVNAIRSIENELCKEIERLSHHYAQMQDRKLQMELRSAFQKAIAELNLDWVKRLRKKPLGKNIHKKINTTGVNRGHQLKLIPDKPPRRRRTRIFDFSWLEDDFRQYSEFNPEFRSYLNKNLRIIYVNNGHPDYQKETVSVDRKKAYFSLITSKELALFTYAKANPEELAEEMIGTEICVKRYL